jgi:hypothetical protein
MNQAGRLWHGALFAVVAAALIAQIVLILAGGADANSGRTDPHLPPGARLFLMFSYFTIQSNILVAATSLALVLHPDRDGRLWRVLRLDAVLGIAITGVVFAIVLAPLVHLTGIAHVITVGLHYIAPPATVIGWVLFGPRGWTDPATLLRAFAWPVLWIAYTYVHGALSGWYPYPFLNAATLGYAVALRNTAFVLIGAVAVALLLATVDRVMRTSARTAPSR